MYCITVCYCTVVKNFEFNTEIQQYTKHDEFPITPKRPQCLNISYLENKLNSTHETKARPCINRSSSISEKIMHLNYFIERRFISSKIRIQPTDREIIKHG